MEPTPGYAREERTVNAQLWFLEQGKTAKKIKVSFRLARSRGLYSEYGTVRQSGA